MSVEIGYNTIPCDAISFVDRFFLVISMVKNKRFMDQKPHKNPIINEARSR